jgi:hypothetical protein
VFFLNYDVSVWGSGTYVSYKYSENLFTMTLFELAYDGHYILYLYALVWIYKLWPIDQ